MEDTNLQSEFDSVFEGDEAINMILKISSDSYTRSIKRIKLGTLGYLEPLKVGRKTSIIGLTSTVKDMGVFSPIHVMTLEEDGMYQVIDGMRRVYAALRNGMEEVDAVVWDFKDKDYGSDMALALSLLLNRNTEHQWSERWDLFKALEASYEGITPGAMEYLLQMNAGDAMKLKDLMMADYDEPKEKLLSGEKDLDGAYKLLQKARKEEDKLAIADNTGVVDLVEEGEALSGGNTGDGLSDDEVRELLDMANNIDDLELTDEDFSDINKSLFEAERQRVGERHPVDKGIREGTFNRDDYKCRCCGTGGAAFLGALIYHHVVPVAAGGPDTIENGLTLCDACHLTLHCAQKAGGSIPITKEQFEKYSEDDQKRIARINKYAKVAVQACLNAGRTKKDIEEDSRLRHRMPGEDLKDNQLSYARYESTRG